MAEETAAPKPAKKPPRLDLRSDAAQERIAKQDAAEAAPPPSPAPSSPPAPSGSSGGRVSVSGFDLWNPTPMQNLVLGGGLIALNFFTQTDLGTLFQRLWTAPQSAADVQKQTKFGAGSLWTLAGEGIFVLVLSFLTGVSSTLGRGIMLFYLALYLVWLVFNGQKLSVFGNVLQGITPPSTSTQLNTSGGGKPS